MTQPPGPGASSPPQAECSLLAALFNAQRFEELEGRARLLTEQFPESGFVWKLLGGSLWMQGKGALQALQRAAALLPDDAEAHCNLGVVLKDCGELDGAIESYRRALAIRPLYAEAHINLGNALSDLGQLDQAVASYRRAVEIKPGSAEAHNNLGYALQGLGQLEEAAGSYRRALAIRPDFAQAHGNLGYALQNLGQLDEAAASYERARELQPNALQHAIHARLLLPVIPDSAASVAAWRKRFLEGIAALGKETGRLEHGPRDVDSASFYLAYHDECDRAVMESLCGLFRAKLPELTFAAPHASGRPPRGTRKRRIRVGFLSEYLAGHTIGKHYKGFIHRLDRSRFEVWVIHAPRTRRDAFSLELDSLADRALTLPARLERQQQAVADERLDVLFYPDIGMSPSTYFLAYARLAPVQATSWGHPDTSGLDTLDYYVSSVLNEPEDADGQYSERLIRLNRLPCFYYRPRTSLAGALTRADLGLPPTGILYGCPQTLFKLHPDFDAVLAAIAHGDPTGHIVLPEGTFSAWTTLLKARWARSFPVLLRRALFLPRMPWDRFMAVMEHMDLLLDPLHFGSGNTLYDAMALGIPVVTWPGRFARGRNVAAAYRQMGVTAAPVALRVEDYAPLALALARDRERRLALRQALSDAAGRELFEDEQAVRELEAFLEAAVAAAGRGKKLPRGWKPEMRSSGS